jgi:hypothetical protein
MSARLPILRPLLLVLALPLGALTCIGAVARTEANAAPPAGVASPAGAHGPVGSAPERDPGAPQEREPAARRSR